MKLNRAAGIVGVAGSALRESELVDEMLGFCGRMVDDVKQ